MMILEEYIAKMDLTKRPELQLKVSYALFLTCKYQGRQRRHSGEFYEEHYLDASYKMYIYNMPDVAIVGAILHDILEDVDARLRKAVADEIVALCGQDVLDWVEALSKRPKSEYRNNEKGRSGEYHTRLINFAITVDWSVIFGKSADRTHNLETLGGLDDDPEKQKRIANETIDFYIPFLRGKAKSIVPVEYHHRLDFYASKMEHLALSFLESHKFLENVQIPAA